jgi:hypothetical protein
LSLLAKEIAMLAEARLVTPDGKIIILSPRDYQKVIESLVVPVAPPSAATADVRALVRELRGKYAGGSSLTEALLRERRAELEREEARIRRHE